MGIRRHEYEMIKIWLMANEEIASEEDLARLNRWLDENADARHMLFELTRHQGWLAWHGAAAPGAALAALENHRHRPTVAEQGFAATPPPRKSAGGSRRGRATTELLHRVRGFGRSVWNRAATARIPLVSFRMAGLMSCIAVAMWLWTYGADGDRNASKRQLPSQLRAEIVNATVCVWGASNGVTPTLGRRFVEGDSVQLLEGVAELHVAGGLSEATLQLEGPAALVLAKHGISTLRYGKVTIQASHSARGSFPVETSFGRVSVDPGAEIGVSSFGDSAEVHVFEGTATLQSPWLVSTDGEFVTRTIQAGEMLKLNQANDASLQIATDNADRECFTSSLSMDSNFLSVGLPYVREIQQAKPVAYWRFERTVDGRVPNEMGSRFEGRMAGNCRLIGPSGGQALEVGILPKAGSMRVEEPWDEVFAGDFALEFWMKPSHYHVGTVLSFVGEFDPRLNKNGHGVAVEVQGGWGHEATTCRVRFTHRAPLSVENGTSLYSDQTYSPRRWQHVVATRSGTSLALYLDGKLVQERVDATATPTNLQLIIGQLYTDFLYRPFIGYLDEMAIYDRALSEEEIKRHFDLLRAPAPSPDAA